MSKFELNDAVTEAAQSRPVRDGIAKVADGIYDRAVSIAMDAGAVSFARSLRREDGVRPGTEAVGGYRRPFARVIASSEGAEAVEHGDVGVNRVAVLARATWGG